MGARERDAARGRGIRPTVDDSPAPLRPKIAARHEVDLDASAAASHHAINRWALHWGKRLLGWIALLLSGAGLGHFTRDDRPGPISSASASGPTPAPTTAPAPATANPAPLASADDEICEATRDACELAAAEHVRCQNNARLAIDTFTASALACGADTRKMPHPEPPP